MNQLHFAIKPVRCRITFVQQAKMIIHYFPTRKVRRMVSPDRGIDTGPGL